MQPALAPGFSDVATNVFNVTQCDFFHGFQVSIAKKFKSKYHVIQSFSMRPRVYPLELSGQMNEPKHTAAFQTIVLTNLFELPLQFSSSNLNPFQCQLSVPMSESTFISGSVGTSGILISAQNASERRNTKIDLQTNFRLESTFSIDSTLLFNRSLIIGACISKSLDQKKANISFLAQKQFKEKTFCSLLNFDESSSLHIGVTHTIVPNTVAGLTLKVALSDLDSELKFGFQRGFKLSRICTNFSSKGIVQSMFQRNLKQGVVLSVSSFADQINQIYSVGLGVSIE